MKKFTQALFVLLLVATLVLAASGVQGASIPDSGWWTALYIQNAGSDSTTIESVAVRMLTPGPSPTPPPAGTATQTPMPRPMEAYYAFPVEVNPVATGVAISLLPHDFRGWSQGNFIQMPADFVGSLLMNASGPANMVLELTNRPISPYGVTDGKAVAQYEGTYFSAPSTTLYFPVAKNDASGKSSTLFLQNVDLSADQIDFRFNCGTFDNPVNYPTATVRPGETIAVSPSEAGVGTGKVCAVKVTADVLLVGMYTEHYTAESPATLLQASRALTSQDVANADNGSTLYVPVFKEQAPVHATQSRTTGLTIMSVAASGSANVTASFRCGGNTYSETKSVSAGYAVTFLHPSSVPPVPAGCVGAATVSSIASIVGMESEAFLNPVPAQGSQSATISPLLPAPAAATKVFMPVYKEEYNNRTSGIYVMNTDASHTAAVTLVFQTANSSYSTSSQNIGPLQMHAWSLLAGLGSGVYSVTAYSDYPIVTNVTEATYISSGDRPYYCFGSSATCHDRSNYVGLK